MEQTHKERSGEAEGKEDEDLLAYWWLAKIHKESDLVHRYGQIAYKCTAPNKLITKKAAFLLNCSDQRFPLRYGTSSEEVILEL